MVKKSKAKKTVKKPIAKSAAVKAKDVSSARGAGVNYWKIINDSLKFSFSLDKVGMVYLIMLPLIASLLWLGYNLLSLGNRISELMVPETTPSPAVVSAVAGPIVLLLGYIIIMVFLQTLMRIGIIENANAYAKGRKESLFASIKAASPRYWTVLSAILMLAVFSALINSMFGAIPVAGAVLSKYYIASILITLLTFVFLQAIIFLGEDPFMNVWSFLVGLVIFVFAFFVTAISLSLVVNSEVATFLGFFVASLLILIIALRVKSSKGIFDSYKESYNVFVKNPGELILMVLATILVEFLMVLVMLLVFLPFGWSTLIQIVSAGPTIDPYMAMAAVRDNYAMLSAGVFVVAILWAYMSVFADAVKTFFYLRIKKL